VEPSRPAGSDDPTKIGVIVIATSNSSDCGWNLKTQMSPSWNID